MTDRALDARRVAVWVVEAALEEGRALDQALEAAPGRGALEPRDRAFAHAIAATTVRRLGRLDAAIATFVQRPLPAKAKRARTLLRTAAVQLLFMGVPPYAVVNAATALADEHPGSRRFKGLINAVLRRIADQGETVINPMTALDDWPAWLTKAWVRDYGADTARAIAEASGCEAPLDLSAKTAPAEVAEAVGGAVLASGTVRVDNPSGPPTALPGFSTGEWWVQDAAAAAPARVFGDVNGRRIIDLCAAPGGKTMQLAAAGADVVAVDRDPDRLARVADNLARTGLNAHIVACDALEFTPDQPADGVLVDAPCSATGTLRRRPDVAWSKSSRDVAALAKVQRAILVAAAQMVVPGGRVVFCTCSLQSEEGAAVVEAALAAGAPLTRDPLGPSGAPGFEHALTPDGDLRIHPAQPGGGDGFFVARLRRTRA